MANKIIVVTGPHEGVGKTTLAVNLAARQAQVRKLPVILVDTDPFCRGETSLVAGASASLSVFQILEQLVNKQITIPMLRGRIPLNRLNIGTISLAPVERESGKMTSEQWIFFLQALAQVYDVVIDIEESSPLKEPSVEVADAIIWTFLPNALSMKATLLQMEVFQNQKLGFAKVLLALNQTGASQHEIADTAINESLVRFSKELCARLPPERELLHLLNQGRPSVIESTKSSYAQQIGRIVDQISLLKRATVTQSGGNGAGLSSTSGGALKNNLNKLQHTVVDSMRDEKRKRWDATKLGIHRALVEELNIRRIDLDTKGDPVRERQLRTNVESTVNSIIGKEKDLIFSREDHDRLVKELVDEALGLGPLEELLADPSITEIMVNRFDQVYVERKGKITLSDKRFIDNNHVVQVVRRIIAPLGRRIDESVPMVDARLKDGSRVNAIIPPLAVNGPSITIRRFPEKAFSAEDLIQMGAITPFMV
jgi:pilus assembly protein CpaF